MHRVSTIGMERLRWLASAVFFFLALMKTKTMISHGLEPYTAFVELIGLPESFKYYGYVALSIEYFSATGIWTRRAFTLAVLLMSGLTLSGVAVSIYSLIFKFNSDCGCGLMGDNEYIFLLQKVLILGALVILFRNKKVLFDGN